MDSKEALCLFKPKVEDELEEENPEPVTEDDRKLDRRTTYILDNYANMVHDKTMAQMCEDVAVVRSVVSNSYRKKYRLALWTMDPTLIKQFGDILVEFPGLTPIGRTWRAEGSSAAT